MGRTLGELDAAGMAWIEEVDFLPSEGQTIEDGRRELNRAIAGWDHGD